MYQFQRHLLVTAKRECFSVPTICVPIRNLCVILTMTVEITLTRVIVVVSYLGQWSSSLYFFLSFWSFKSYFSSSTFLSQLKALILTETLSSFCICSNWNIGEISIFDMQSLCRLGARSAQGISIHDRKYIYVERFTRLW